MHNYAGCIWRENCPDRSIKPLKKSIYCVVSQCSGSISISGSGLLSENFPHLFQGTKVKLKKNLASFALTILGGFGSFQNSLIRIEGIWIRYAGSVTFMHIAYALKSQLIKLNQIYVLTLQLPYVSLSLFFFWLCLCLCPCQFLFLSLCLFSLLAFTISVCLILFLFGLCIFFFSIPRALFCLDASQSKICND